MFHRRHASILLAKRSAAAGGAGAAASTRHPLGSNTHYSFGSNVKKPASATEAPKKDFRDHFEFEGTVAKDSTIEDTQVSWFRVFWAKPLEHKDDAELQQKKDFERMHSMRGHYGQLWDLGEDSAARMAPPGSRLHYFRKHVGGIVWLQVWIQLVITAGAYGLLALGVLEREALHRWWNESSFAPFSIDFAAPESSATEPWKDLPLVGGEMSCEQLDMFHTANALGNWTMPFQFLPTWALHPYAKAVVDRWQWVKRLRRAMDVAVHDAKKMATRPRV